MKIDKYPIRKVLRLDPLPVASSIESVVGDYLLDPLPGIYVKGRFEPVMVSAKIYYQRALDVRGQRTGPLQTVRSIEEIHRGAVVTDADGTVVVTVNQIPFLSTAPTLPARGLQIVERSLRDVVDTYGDPQHHTGSRDPVRMYIDLIKPEYRDCLEIIDHILSVMSAMRGQVRDFAGDDKWIVHFLKRDRFSLVIEKSIDWRIIDWYRLTASR